MSVGAATMAVMTTADATLNSVAAHWDARADTFDTEPDHGLRSPAVRAAWAARMREWVPDEGSAVLDAGCGTGSLSALLAARGCRVTGVDLSANMVAAARRKLAGLAAEVLQGDAAAPPVAGRRFDVVLVRHLLWTLPDPVAALRNWVRLLRPGGHLVLVEGRWKIPAQPNPAMPWWGGISADRLALAVGPMVTRVHTELLTDPALWGGPVDDERYVLLAHI
jgi:SAM-dependent methyltransferase